MNNAVEDRFHVDIGQIREFFVMFGFAPCENGLSEPEYDDGPFFDEGQKDMRKKGMKRCRR